MVPNLVKKSLFKYLSTQRRVAVIVPRTESTRLMHNILIPLENNLRPLYFYKNLQISYINELFFFLSFARLGLPDALFLIVQL